MRRLVPLLVVLVLAGLVVAFRAAARPDGPCAKYGPAYVEHRIARAQAEQGMGSTGTAADEGQIACVPRSMKADLDDPYTPNNPNPDPPKMVQ
jgi:hypothetical protein